MTECCMGSTGESVLAREKLHRGPPSTFTATFEQGTGFKGYRPLVCARQGLMLGILSNLPSTVGV